MHVEVIVVSRLPADPLLSLAICNLNFGIYLVYCCLRTQFVTKYSLEEDTAIYVPLAILRAT